MACQPRVGRESRTILSELLHTRKTDHHKRPTSDAVWTAREVSMCSMRRQFLIVLDQRDTIVNSRLGKLTIMSRDRGKKRSNQLQTTLEREATRILGSRIVRACYGNVAYTTKLSFRKPTLTGQADPGRIAVRAISASGSRPAPMETAWHPGPSESRHPDHQRGSVLKTLFRQRPSDIGVWQPPLGEAPQWPLRLLAGPRDAFRRRDQAIAPRKEVVYLLLLR